MPKKQFIVEDWLNQPAPAPEITKRATSAHIPQTSVQEDIEIIIQRIEAAHTDITAGYSNWLDLGFALSEELGEAGRDYFHRISRFNPDYNHAETDKQFNNCLKSGGSGVTIKTFFQKAKEAGISISTGSKSAISAEYAKSAPHRNAEIKSKSAESLTAEIADIAETAEMKKGRF